MKRCFIFKWKIGTRSIKLLPLNTTFRAHMEPSPCGTPAPTPRLPPLHRNGPLAGACPVSQSGGAGSAACTCPGAFANCILLWLQPPRQKEHSRLQKLALGKPMEHAHEAKAAGPQHALHPGPSFPADPKSQKTPTDTATSSATCTQDTFEAGVRTRLLYATLCGWHWAPQLSWPWALAGQLLLTGYLFPHPLAVHTHPDSLRV